MKSYKHQMAAHCESGAVTAQIKQAGFTITEPMVFGISGALFFGYFKIPALDFPTFVLRNQPGKIRKTVQKRLGLTIQGKKFRNSDSAMEALDEFLSQGIAVAVQVDFFYMNYIPAYARAHFNAHFINVVGKEGSHYLVSDSYYPEIAKLDAETLKIARSAKGCYGPKNYQFIVRGFNEKVNLKKAIKAGIQQTCFYMLKVPIPFMGVRGIRHFGDKILTWPDLCRDIDHLSHEIMMIHVILEDRGTGGGGFRYLYSSFLKETAALLENPHLDELAVKMMKNGDEWRKISLFVARAGKEKDLGTEKLQELRQLIHERAEVEKELFGRLYKVAKTL